MNFFYLFALAEQIRITFAASSQKSGLMVAQERAPSKDREPIRFLRCGLAG